MRLHQIEKDMDQHEDLFKAALSAVAAHTKEDSESTNDSASQTLDLENELGLTPSKSKKMDPFLDLSAFEDPNVLSEREKQLAEKDKLIEDLQKQLSAHQRLNAVFQNQQAVFKSQMEALQAKFQELKNENDQLRAIQKQYNDKLVRANADYDNYRKRVARDQELMKFQAEEKIVSGFLPVMDNLERALTHAKQSDDFAKLLQGVEMTGKLYLAALAKHGCKPYDSLGQTVDPVYHDVLQRVVNEDVPHNIIVQEHLKGYMMHDRVLRPALVVVSQHENGDDEVANAQAAQACVTQDTTSDETAAQAAAQPDVSDNHVESSVPAAENNSSEGEV